MTEEKNAIRHGQDLLRRTLFISMATSSLKGEPWCSPVFFSFDGEMNIYWISSPKALHSRNLHENPLVSLTLYNSTGSDGAGDGLYIKGKAVRLLDHEAVAHASEIIARRAYGAKREPSLMAREDSPRNFYCAKPQAVYYNTLEDQSGMLVDVRKELDISHFKNMMNF